MSNKSIVILAGKGLSTNILYNSLSKEFTVSGLIIEKSVSKTSFLRNRIKKLGIFKVLDQLLFQLSLTKLLYFISAKRRRKILDDHSLSGLPIDDSRIIPVQSVNSDACIAIIKELNPSLIIVNGTRIISKKVLEAINCDFVNMHAGITPKYRGVHGGYWALVNNDIKNCGVTVHLVDKGIDTGGILYQGHIAPSGHDNFTTYPLLQQATGIPLLKQAIHDAFDNRLKTIEGPKESNVWYHPGLFTYIRNYLLTGIK